MEKNKFWNKKNIIFISIGTIILGAIVFWIITAQKPDSIKTEKVSRGEVISELSLTGRVTAAKDINLGFERNGRIQEVYAKVGTKISQGNRIIELENSDLRAQVSQAQATVRSQKAKLNEILAGTRPETIRIKESELQKAQQDLDNYYSGVKDIVVDGFAKADDAVRAKVADLFINGDTTSPKLSFQTNNSQAEIDAIAFRIRANKELFDWRNELSSLSYNSSNEILLNALELARMRTSIVNSLLTSSFDAVEASSLSETNKSSYKTNISTARTSINLIRTSITSQLQLINSQKNTLEKIKNELALQKAGSTKEEIDNQRAQVDQAEANAIYTSSQLEKTILRAPFDGIITKLSKIRGDIVSPNEEVVSLIGLGNFQVELNVSESDISKIKLGNSAIITFDAYENDMIFDARVIQIDLSETKIDSVATYKVVLEFLKENPKIISGLTANVIIKTDKKENVLFISQRNIVNENGKKMVKRLINEKTKEIEKKEIKVGLRGSDGRIEVVEGLSEGDVIVSE